LLSDLCIFAGFRWAEPAAVFKDILCISKESWVTMEVDLTFFRLVPLCVEEKIFCVKQLFNLAGIVFWSVRDCKSVIVGD
jgi:hypothetical protein